MGTVAEDGARQGDIALMPLPDPFEKMKKVEPENGRLIVAYGEATGHHHALIGDAEVRRDSRGNLTIKVGPEGAKVRSSRTWRDRT